jgi:hypothetical protein
MQRERERVEWKWVLLSLAVALLLLFWAYYQEGFWQAVLVEFGATVGLIGFVLFLENRIVRRIVDLVVQVPTIDQRATVFPPTVTKD